MKDRQALVVLSLGSLLLACSGSDGPQTDSTDGVSSGAAGHAGAAAGGGAGAAGGSAGAAGGSAGAAGAAAGGAGAAGGSAGAAGGSAGAAGAAAGGGAAGKSGGSGGPPGGPPSGVPMCGLGTLCYDCQCVAGTLCLFGGGTSGPTCQKPPVQCAASVAAGAPCSGSAECDVSAKEVAVCVQGAWWVGTIAGKTTDTSKGCEPEGSWHLAYAPTETPCGVSLPPDGLQIRRVHNGYDRAVSFAGFASVSMPVDGCKLSASRSVSVPGETASVVEDVALSFTGSPAGTLHVSTTAACSPPESTSAIALSKL